MFEQDAELWCCLSKKQGDRLGQERISIPLNSGQSPLPSPRWLMAAPSHCSGAPSIRLGLVKSQLPTITCALLYPHRQLINLCSTRRKAGIIKNTALRQAPWLQCWIIPVTLNREGKAKVQHWSVLQKDRTIKCKCRIKEICTNWIWELASGNGVAVTLGVYIKKMDCNRKELHWGDGNKMVKTWMFPFLGTELLGFHV